MTIIDVVKIAFTNLRGNKMRTALTVLGIGVGIATIVLLVSLGYGLQDLSMKRIASIGAISTINVSAGKVTAPDKTFAEKYKNDSRVEKVLVVNSIPVKNSFAEKTIDGVASIVPKDFFDLEGIKLEAGDFYSDDSTNSAVISTGFAKGMDKPIANLIGQVVDIKLFAKDQNGITKSINAEVKVMGAFIDDSTVIAFLSPDLLLQTGEMPITQVKVKAKDQKDLVALKTEIENSGYGVASVADTIGQVNMVFNIIKIILAIFGGVALVVASIGMFNTMTIALLERTRDVGIMKATGTNDRAVYLIFLSEAVLISISGGLFGLVLGYLTTLAINFGINVLATSVGGEAVDLFLTPLGFVTIIFSFSLVVGISTGFLPARRASKLNPLEALRYE